MASAFRKRRERNGFVQRYREFLYNAYMSEKRRESLADYLDRCLTPLGFTRDSGGLAGQNYLGEVNGRILKFHCSVRKRTRYAGEVRYRRYVGHRIEMSFKTNVKTRLVLAPKGTAGMMSGVAAFANRRTGSIKVTDLDPMFAYLDVWAVEPDWARELLQNGRLQQAILDLMPPENLPANVGVKLWPGNGSFSQRTAIGNLTPESAAQWVTAVTTFADLVEENPPMNEIQPSWLEQKSEQNPTAVGLIMVAALLGIPILLLFICMVCTLSFIGLAGL